MKKIILTLAFLFLLVKTNAQNNRGYSDKKQESGICLVVGGVAFTTAAILENSYNYTTPTSTGPYNSGYTTKPFYQQTPRNIMFVVGITITISGLIVLGTNK